MNASLLLKSKLNVYFPGPKVPIINAHIFIENIHHSSVTFLEEKVSEPLALPAA